MRYTIFFSLFYLIPVLVHLAQLSTHSFCSYCASFIPKGLPTLVFSVPFFFIMDTLNICAHTYTHSHRCMNAHIHMHASMHMYDKDKNVEMVPKSL